MWQMPFKFVFCAPSSNYNFNSFLFHLSDLYANTHSLCLIDRLHIPCRRRQDAELRRNSVYWKIVFNYTELKLPPHPMMVRGDGSPAQHSYTTTLDAVAEQNDVNNVSVCWTTTLMKRRYWTIKVTNKIPNDTVSIIRWRVYDRREHCRRIWIWPANEHSEQCTTAPTNIEQIAASRLTPERTRVRAGWMADGAGWQRLIAKAVPRVFSLSPSCAR